MNNSKIMLLFGVGRDALADLSRIASTYGVEVINVRKEDYGLPIDSLISGKRVIGIMPYIGPDFGESMMLLHGLQGTQFNNVVSAAGASQYRPGLVAVTTETNLKWSSLNLYANLIQERNQIRNLKARNAR